MKTKILFGCYPSFPIEGVTFIDLTPSLFDVSVRDNIINSLIEIQDFDNTMIKEIDYIISPDARGFIWGSMVAEKYNLGFIPVRKSGKLPVDAITCGVDYKTEYSTTSLVLPKIDLKNKKVLFIDDVYATGGTYQAVKQLVAKAGGIVLGASVLVDIDLVKTTEIKSLAKVNELL